ncbi:rhodanese-related sulfurtransferase [Gloeocapsa sp. PCC 73106]|uniref:oxygen-dependent tRNA uridine(34) hydroxylase TrhO n=1 Tax=Gloeocapsa sp. PCC 73106 TaxID=102232 RepID=UPI0002ACF8C2|nr:putative sulfurtransferase [Gloeocapsa sp. PCC 73106]
MKFVVATFYKFVSLPDFAEKKPSLLLKCQEENIKGTILLASEGINGTICGFSHSISAILAFLRSDTRLEDLRALESPCDFIPFDRLKVRLKKEIVTIGIKEVDASNQVGTYIEPQNWNNLILDPEVLVIDTRNDYEFELGTFKNAINPETESFGEFPDYVRSQLAGNKQQKLALFCTGGIRCEKATSFLLDQGFTEVYHLKGGILKYLTDVPTEESLWEGECFVFDQRVILSDKT